MRSFVPTGKYENIEEYLAKSNDNGAWVRVVYQGGIQPLSPAKTVEISHRWHYNSYMGESIRLSRAYLARIPNLRLIQIKEVLCLITPDNRLLLDADHQQARSDLLEVFGLSEWPDLKKFEGRALILPTRSGPVNYWHWLFDLLPLFSVIKSARIPLNSFDALCIYGICRPFQIEMLEALGEPLPMVLKAAENRHILFNDAFFASNPGLENAASPWKIAFLRDLFLGQTYRRRGERLVYISRRGGNRTFSNEPEVHKFLVGKGFEVWDFDGISIREQARIFAESRLILAGHGSALGNLVFCTAGAKVIEIHSPFYVVDYFRSICSALGLDYYYMIGEGEIVNIEIPALLHSGFPVSLKKLARTLELAGL